MSEYDKQKDIEAEGQRAALYHQKPRVLTLADMAPGIAVEEYRRTHGGRLPDYPLDPPPTETEGYWCDACRATGAAHCSDPGPCGGMEILPKDEIARRHATQGQPSGVLRQEGE